MRIFVVLVVFFLFLPLGSSAFEEGIYTVSIKKQEEKKRQRWSLADWFETKNIMRMQDLWLAMHTSVTTFEFFVGGETATFDLSSLASGTEITDSYKVSRYVFASYATIFGLQGTYVTSTDKLKGYNASFHIRILGTAVQNTNLTLAYGVRNREDTSTTTTETFKNNYAEASLTIYLAKQFGIEGIYQKILKSDSDLMTSLDGSRTEGTVFIDYNILRVQGTWFNEPLTFTDLSGNITEKTSSGILAGLRFYF